MNEQSSPAGTNPGPDPLVASPCSSHALARNRGLHAVPRPRPNALSHTAMSASPSLVQTVPDSAEASAPDGSFVRFPDSPFELYQPYPPAGDQPEAIDKLVEGVRDGEVF